MLDILSAEWMRAYRERGRSSDGPTLDEQAAEGFNHRWDGYEVHSDEGHEPHPSAGKFGRVMRERDVSGRDLV